MEYVKHKINEHKKPGSSGNLHLIINPCSIHSIYTSHIFTSVGSRNLCSGKWLSIFRSRSIFSFFLFLLHFTERRNHVNNSQIDWNSMIIHSIFAHISFEIERFISKIALPNNFKRNRSSWNCRILYRWSILKRQIEYFS